MSVSRQGKSKKGGALFCQGQKIGLHQHILFTKLHLFLLAFASLFLFHSLTYGTELKQEKRVLVLYSEDKAHPAHELTDQGIRTAFRSNKRFNVQLYTEYLDLSRFSGSAYVHTMADYLNHKYAGTEIDAIIAVYPAAIDFLMHEEGKVFPGVPIVACEIIRETAENLDRSPWRRITTGVIIGDNAAGVLESALRLRPGTRSVALVAGTAPNDAYNGFSRALESYAGKIELIDLGKLPMQETLARVGSLPPHTIVLYSSIFRDGANQIFVPREALSLISAAANQPVFGLYDSYMGYGIVGGNLMSFEQQGREAATLTLRVLAGESPASIPFGGEQAYVSAYDWRELKRWGISEKALPPGSVVKFKSGSMWEEHREEILGGMFFISIETLLIIGLFVNLHKRRRAEAEIAASALRYRTVADHTYDWEYWSAPDGTISYVSPSCERISGYSAREFMDDPTLFLKIIFQEDRRTWDGHAHDVRNRQKASEIQFRIRTKGGEIRWIDHICLPVHDGQGKFLGIRASNRDISERKKAEFEVQQQRNELAHVTRVAALGELTSSIAHELNQPLAAIRNYANAAQRFLSQSEPDLGKARDALEGIVRDDRRAAEVISRVRELMKKEEPRYLALQMNQVIQEALAFVRSDAVIEGLTIETGLAPALPVVMGDRVQLQQVLLNLILNAVDAMNKVEPDQRKLVIKTENKEHRDVQVSVRDLGAGIDEAHRAKLFESFFSTKPKGMGIGLAISQRIIHAHGGTIWGENNPDGGATFGFTLPAGNNG
jgi:PAS domain S-box-containing protein